MGPLLGVLAAACGGDDDPAGRAGGAPSGSATAPAPGATIDPTTAFRDLEYPADLIDGQAIGKADAPITLTARDQFGAVIGPVSFDIPASGEGVTLENHL